VLYFHFQVFDELFINRAGCRRRTSYREFCIIDGVDGRWAPKDTSHTFATPSTLNLRGLR